MLGRLCEIIGLIGLSFQRGAVRTEMKRSRQGLCEGLLLGKRIHHQGVRAREDAINGCLIHSRVVCTKLDAGQALWLTVYQIQGASIVVRDTRRARVNIGRVGKRSLLHSLDVMPAQYLAGRCIDLRQV